MVPARVRRRVLTPAVGVVVAAVTVDACSDSIVSQQEPVQPSLDAGAPEAPVEIRVDAGATDAPSEAASDGGWAANGARDNDESDVDCGGLAGAPPCAAGKACLLHRDCASNGCRTDSRCAAAPSCTEHFGSDTCGPNGTDDCCRAIPVPRPGAPFVLDKYSITAGRFRQFVERTSGDIRGYVQAHRPKGWEAGWDAWLPNKMDTGTYDGRDGVVQQLGPHLYYDATGGNSGCQVEDVGARTYWLPAATNTDRFGDVQRYDKDTLDQKPMVCATWMMFAAFCAWDGGRLPTLEEHDYAWNAGHPESYFFPWGNGPRPSGFTYAYDDEVSALSFGEVRCGAYGDPTAACDRTRASFRYNSWTPAALVADDRSVFIPPPGRFPAGDGPFGHSDLAGLVFNYTATLDGAVGGDPLVRLSMLSRGGSWQGHEIPYYNAGEAYGWKMASKYWATGARCAR